LLAARTTNEENQHRHAGAGFAGLSALMYLDKHWLAAPKLK
jgi:hypothetical protein